MASLAAQLHSSRLQSYRPYSSPCHRCTRGLMPHHSCYSCASSGRGPGSSRGYQPRSSGRPSGSGRGTRVLFFPELRVLRLIPTGVETRIPTGVEIRTNFRSVRVSDLDGTWGTPDIVLFVSGEAPAKAVAGTGATEK